MIDTVDATLKQAADLQALGEHRAAIDLLTNANRRAHDGRLECALVEHRIRASAESPRPDQPVVVEPIMADGAGGEIFAVDAAEMSVSALRTGIARSGCLLVRGLVSPERCAQLASGIDAALAAFDATEAGETVDPGWYTPRRVDDRAGAGEVLTGKLNRQMGALWTVFSPRMVFELLELVDDVGIGSLMVEFLGERPTLSANKCTLRRVPPEDMLTGWHQDGAFLGDYIGSFNFWLALSACGTDAPGLDIVPRRFDGILPTGGKGAIFKWSLSDRTVSEGSGGTPIVRPQFEAGDALLFDHRLVHRTASSSAMTHERYAIESWFFTPSAYPNDQVPLLY